VSTLASILPVADGPTTRRGLARHVRRHRGWLTLVVAAQLLASAAGLVGPHLLQDLLNRAGHETSTAISHDVLLFAIALGFQTIFTGTASATGAAVGERVLANMREELVAAVLQLPLGFVERAGTGDLMSRASTDIDEMSRALRYGLPQLVVAAVTAVLAVAALVITAPVLGLVLVPVVPMVSVAARWYLKRARPAYRAQMACWAATNATLQETVAAARTIDAFRLGPLRTQKADSTISDWIGWERRTLGMRTVFFGTTEAGYVVPLVLCLLLGGLLAINGHLSVGAVAAATLYTQQLISPVDTLLSWQDEVQQASASLSRVLGVSSVDGGLFTDEVPVGQSLVVEDLHFAYTGHDDVLKGIDMAPEPGARLVIVGPSGAGKSTLAQLLVGIHAPRLGTVRVGGVEPHRLEPSVLRKEIALVTQEQHLFACSVRDNLRLGCPGADDEVMYGVLDAIGAADATRALPEGLATVIGSGGAQVSPALAQQLAIARLLLADPHTLVLDEATSLLSTQSARDIERSVAQLLDGRTVIAISHRLHAAHDAEVVAVVEAGRITEMGTHATLMAKGGAYSDLWNAWQQDGTGPGAVPG
jgi:ABC-type multidrug transport system fused ATPase/permease subunit